MSLTECIAEMMNRMPVKSLESVCPDWIEPIVKDGKIRDVTLHSFQETTKSAHVGMGAQNRIKTTYD